MNIEELKIKDSYKIIPKIFPDDRGLFLEWFKAEPLADVLGHNMNIAQSNMSVSKKGTLRGIHYAQVAPSQAKYVTCTSGSVLDFIIDIRVGSPTFGQWDSVLLNDSNRNAVYISEGLGHAFLALSDKAIVNYLVSAPYNPEREFGINPLDKEIGLDFSALDAELLLSPKDTSAPSLSEALSQGILPNFTETQEFYNSLKKKRNN